MHFSFLIIPFTTLDKKDLISRVRRVEIKTRALTNNIFAGEYHSAFKGKGMSFSEVREYQMGDDVRDIDWNVTARLGFPHVKVYEEERELTVMLLIDVSRSLDFGTQKHTVREMVLEIAATLAFSANQNNDKIGVILFSDHVEKFIPPKKGRKHILYIIRELLEFKATHTHTNLNSGIEFLMKALKKQCICFVLSDFLDEHDYKHALLMANKKHDLVAIRVADKRLKELPNVGLLRIFDAESRETQYIDTSSRALRAEQLRWWTATTEQIVNIFQQCGINHTIVDTNSDYVRQLLHLFAHRSRR